VEEALINKEKIKVKKQALGVRDVIGEEGLLNYPYLSFTFLYYPLLSVYLR